MRRLVALEFGDEQRTDRIEEQQIEAIRNTRLATLPLIKPSRHHERVPTNDPGMIFEPPLQVSPLPNTDLGQAHVRQARDPRLVRSMAKLTSASPLEELSIASS